MYLLECFGGKFKDIMILLFIFLVLTQCVWCQYECAEYDTILSKGRTKREAKINGYENYDPENSREQVTVAAGDPEVTSPEAPTTLRTTNTSHIPVYAAVGGVNAFAFEFPHMAAVGWPRKGGGYAFNCGGTLISDRFVMTAGHCLSNPRDTSLASTEPTVVRLGDLNILENATDGAEPINIPLSRIIRHPDYSPPRKYYDIALLELQESVPLSDHITPACLWPHSSLEKNSIAIVTGWGTTVSGGRENSAILQKVQVNILETEVCQPLLQGTWNRNWQGFSGHQLCAGVLAGGKDACQGDSGGPLQVRIQGYLNKYHVIGVTSFGRECGRPNLPGVYTRVPAFLDWIESVVWPADAQ